MSESASTQAISEDRFVAIAHQACETTLSQATGYDHNSAESWNSAIINGVLSALVKETKVADSDHTPWKFAVNSTIVQHSAAPKSTGTDAPVDKAKFGRTGMHSAAGAYWNNEKDGMWSYKYEGGEAKGIDVVVLAVFMSI